MNLKEIEEERLEGRWSRNWGDLVGFPNQWSKTNSHTSWCKDGPMFGEKFHNLIRCPGYRAAAFRGTAKLFQDDLLSDMSEMLQQFDYVRYLRKEFWVVLHKVEQTIKTQKASLLKLSDNILTAESNFFPPNYLTVWIDVLIKFATFPDVLK